MVNSVFKKTVYVFIGVFVAFMFIGKIYSGVMRYSNDKRHNEIQNDIVSYDEGSLFTVFKESGKQKIEEHVNKVGIYNGPHCSDSSVSNIQYVGAIKISEYEDEIYMIYKVNADATISKQSGDEYLEQELYEVVKFKDIESENNFEVNASYDEGNVNGFNGAESFEEAVKAIEDITHCECIIIDGKSK